MSNENTEFNTWWESVGGEVLGKNTAFAGWQASAAHSAARIKELEARSAVWRKYAVELHDQLMRRDGIVHVGYAVPSEILTEVTKMTTAEEKRREEYMNYAEQASIANCLSRIAELEGQIGTLLETVEYARDILTKQTGMDSVVYSLNHTLSNYRQDAEKYRKRVQAEALEEAAVRHETWHGFDKHGTSAFLRGMASELRNPAGQAEGKNM